MPYFTVVIPLYNKENYIADTLKSVLAQTFTDFEVLVINDVSTDNSVNMALTFSDNRIKIINHTVNKGLPGSRNTGIENAKGKYVAFLDADDIWKPLFLETIYNLIQSYPEASFFATKYQEIYSGGVIIQLPFNINTGVLDNFFNLNCTKPIYCPSALCVKKDVFDNIGVYQDIYFGEDVDFNIRAHLMYKMAYSNIPLVEYNVHSENQITKSSMAGKSKIDHNYYENAYPERKDLKRYLDFHRYTMAKRYRRSGDIKTYNQLVNEIDIKNLNYKQIILLYSPAFILDFITTLKKTLNKKGINPTSY